MAAGLTPALVRRLLALAGLVMAVLAGHAWLAEQLLRQAELLSAGATMPPRLEAVYVRDMVLAAAAPAGVAVAHPPVRRRASARPVMRPAAASAPVPAPVQVAQPAPSPEPVVAEVVDVDTAAPAVVAEVPPPEGAASQAAAPFEWPESTRMRYVLTGYVRGEVNGQAQVEWIRAGQHYQVHLDVTVGLSFAPLATRHMSSDGEITTEGLVPHRYDQETKLAFDDAYRAVVRFEGDRVLLANGQSIARWPGAQDTASQFVQLSWMFATQPERLRVGNSVEIPLAMPRNLSSWVYDVIAEETLYTPFGELQAFHLKPRRVARAGGDLTTEIWIAPQLRHLPVRFRINQDAETYIDLMLDRRPELAAPDEPPRNPP